RSARGVDRDHPRLGRNAEAGPNGWARLREGARLHGPHGRRRGSAGARPRQCRLRAGGADGAGHRARPCARGEEPARPGAGKGAHEPRAAGGARIGARRRGLRVRRALRERGSKGRHGRVLGEARAAFFRSLAATWSQSYGASARRAALIAPGRPRATSSVAVAGWVSTITCSPARPETASGPSSEPVPTSTCAVAASARTSRAGSATGTAAG